MAKYRGARSVPAIPRRSLRTPRSPRSPPETPASLGNKTKSRQSGVDYVAAIFCLAELHKSHVDDEPNRTAQCVRLGLCREARTRNPQHLAGSNLIRGMTDQGSAGDPNFARGETTFTSAKAKKARGC